MVHHKHLTQQSYRQIPIPDALKQAVAAHRNGRLQDAERLYRAILQVQPQHPDANHNLGVLAQGVGQAEAALPFLQTALTANPKMAQYWLSYASALIDAKQWAKARNLLGQARQHGLSGSGLDALEQRLASALDGVSPLAPAVDLREAGRYGEARAWLAQWLDSNQGQAPSAAIQAEAWALQAQVDLLEERLPAAAQALAKAQALSANHPAVLRNRARLALTRQEPEAALQAAQAALKHNAAEPESRVVLAAALGAAGRDAEALPLLEGVLQQRPDYAEALANRALVRLRGKDLAHAQADAEQALRLKPHLHQLWSLVASLRSQRGDLSGAIEAQRKTLDRTPDDVGRLATLGEFLRQDQRLEEARAVLERAVSLDPGHADAWTNLGTVLQQQDCIDEAKSAYEKALAIRPNSAAIASNLGVMAKAAGDWEQALGYFDQALALDANNAVVLANRGVALANLGRLKEALQAYDEALRIKPEYAVAASNRLLMLHYQEGERALELLAQERGTVKAQRLRTVGPQISFSRPNPGCRLRVGYVSGDFRHHPVGFFVQDLFAQHDRSGIELWAYPTGGKDDAITTRIKGAVDHWQTLVGQTDEAAAARIRADEIDVLIDLSGHTAHNRLGVFAQRAAPVQAHYLGFMGSTGLPEIDYWIGDDLLTPSCMAEQYSEQLWPLARVWVAYHGSEQAPQPAWRPGDDGTLWLGSFNNLLKLTPNTIALWAQVLHALSEGKLLLKTKALADASNRTRVLRAFSEHGISGERIALQDSHATPSWPAHMAYYDRLDIALDPVGPVCGGTTSCDALWMGVPVITKLGDRMGSRMSAAMVNAIGRAEWIAEDDADYIAKVVALARDVERRTTLRATQREQMRQSPLCDAKGLATALEEAYSAMFERWHAEQSAQEPSA